MGILSDIHHTRDRGWSDKNPKKWTYDRSNFIMTMHFADSKVVSVAGLVDTNALRGYTIKRW
jgi:hypothetical protein